MDKAKQVNRKRRILQLLIENKADFKSRSIYTTKLKYLLVLKSTIQYECYKYYSLNNIISKYVNEIKNV